MPSRTRDPAQSFPACARRAPVAPAGVLAPSARRSLIVLDNPLTAAISPRGRNSTRPATVNRSDWPTHAHCGPELLVDEVDEESSALFARLGRADGRHGRACTTGTASPVRPSTCTSSSSGGRASRESVATRAGSGGARTSSAVAAFAQGDGGRRTRFSSSLTRSSIPLPCQKKRFRVLPFSPPPGVAPTVSLSRPCFSTTAMPPFSAKPLKP